MGIEFVSPYELPALDNSISGILKHLPFENAEKDSDKPDVLPVPGFTIPVFKTAGIEQLIRANNIKIKSKADQNDGDSSGSLDTTVRGGAGDEIDAEVGNDDVDNDEPVHFLDIAKLLPTNLQQQITTLTIRGFPGLKKSAIEKVLLLIAGSGAGEFSWSTITMEHTEHRLLFVRFNSILGLGVFVANMNDIKIANVKLFVHSQAEQYIMATSSSPDLSASTSASISAIINNLKNQEHGNSSGTEDLDNILSYYNSYKVEESELVDVPNDMRSGIVRDIIKFRSKVLKIEKQRRKKEIEKERQMAKLKLKRLFQDIQKEQGGTEDEDMESEEPEVIIDEGGGMNDREYEEFLDRKAKAEVEELYKKELKEIKDLETFELNTLQKKLISLENYENNLIENKAKYMDEFKLVGEQNSSLHSKVSLYYSNHSEYLRYRLKEKTIEEKLDSKDREEEEKESQTKEEEKIEFQYSAIQTNTTVSEPTPTVAATDIATSNSSATPTATPTFIATATASSNTHIELESGILSLSTSILASLKSKISDLIEEYLGIKEESLIDFIYEHLQQHNLSKNEDLITELSETLDDDAEIVVEEITKFLLN